MNYRQGDPRWGSMEMGESPYSLAAYGCLTTAHAQAFALAGWASDDPGIVCSELSRAGAYTDHAHPAGPGLLVWGRVGSAFDSYEYRPDGSGRFKFVQVVAQFPSGYRGEHWVLLDGGTYYDPLDGSQGPLKASYRPTGAVRSADIAQAPGEATRFPLTVTVKGPLGLRVRTLPSTDGTVVDPVTLLPSPDAVVDPGASFTAVGEVDGETVSGRSKWLVTRRGLYVWNRDGY